jgi:hypothetical protein
MSWALSNDRKTYLTSSPLAGPIQKLTQPTTSSQRGDTITTCLRSAETESAGWSLDMKQFMDSSWEIWARLIETSSMRSTSLFIWFLFPSERHQCQEKGNNCLAVQHNLVKNQQLDIKTRRVDRLGTNFCKLFHSHSSSGRQVGYSTEQRNCPLKAILFFSPTPFFLICIVGGGVQTGSSRQVGHLLAYCTCPRWLWGWRIWWNEWQGKPKYSEKTCPDPGRRGGKPATNRFSYGAAFPNPLQTTSSQPEQHPELNKFDRYCCSPFLPYKCIRSE